MRERFPISVCMATYNGSKYIEVQLNSILKQLHPNDELIIVDDNSKDNTVEIIKKFDQSLIRLYENSSNIGHVKTFAKAVSFAENEFICFSDQDDEWLDNRLEILLNAIVREKVALVSSNYEINYEKSLDKKFLRLSKKDSKKNLLNILKIFLGTAPYYGCTMMIKHEFKNYILPIPNYIEAHDLWMALGANLLRSSYHLEDNTLKYRIHHNNTSLKKRTFNKKIKTRFYFLKALFNLFLRKYNFKTINH